MKRIPHTLNENFGDADEAGDIFQKFGPSREGSLLLEALVAIAIFALFLGGIGLTLAIGERSTVAGGDHVRAAFVGEQALEAVRQMRNVSFASVTTGTHGVKLINKVWAFTGTSITTSDGYTSKVNVTTKTADWLQVQSTTTWNFGKSRTGSLVLTSYITNWRKPYTIGNWADVSLQSTTSVSGSPSLQKVAVSGNYAYISAAAGNGLYVYDISNPASPVRVSSSLNIGVPVYGLAISGTGLYLATAGPTSEVQLFNIEAPTSLTLSSRMSTYDLPGTGLARSVAVYANTAFIGSLENPGTKEFYSLSVSDTGSLTLLDSIAMSGSVLDISLSDGYAYVASANNAAEFQVIDIFDPTDLQFAPGDGMDLDNTQDGLAMATFGTSALLGRASGSAIDELILYVIGDSPVPSPPPGPWTLELAGDGAAIASVYGGKYAFVGGSGDPNELRVLDIPKMSLGQTPTVDTYNTSASIRGLFYNWQTDRLYGVTTSSMYIFRPG
ncbi:MAG TPA: hypothetical protein PKV72_00885 [Candidatus Peribacteria bacterium]|nr:hypothetical protein [Candidatus Peribacteria bacterium]